ncbi:MAG: DEAD/DEAH box helicase [Acidobacteria bacterium]|nr:DEAD/DEAH box helicase [Acidobacteriota bacterium]
MVGIRDNPPNRESQGFASVLEFLGSAVESNVGELSPHQRIGAGWLVDRIRRYGGAVLADDVGTGKTRTALAASNLLRRDRLAFGVICSPSLVPHWRQEASKQNLAVEIVSTGLLGRRDLPPLDGWIIDEAHAFRNPSTRGWKTLHTLARNHSLILVTATPLWNGLDDLEALIRIFASDSALRCEGVASIARAFADRDRRAISIVFEALVLRRDRSWFDPVASSSLVWRSIGRPGAAEVTALARELQTLTFPLSLSDSAHLQRAFLLARLESGYGALRSSLIRQRRFCSRALSMARRGRRLGRRSDLSDLAIDSDLWQLPLFPSLLGIPLKDPDDLEELEREIDTIDRIARIIPPDDPKLDALTELFVDGPTIIFSSWSESALEIYRRLIEAGVRAVVVTAGRTERSGVACSHFEAIELFRTGGADTLVATDLAGEGLNLQRARRIVHWDVPWSPVRLDQRNVRAWRMGQIHDVEVVLFRPVVSFRQHALFHKEAQKQSWLDACSIPGPEAAPRQPVVPSERGVLLLMEHRSTPRAILFDAHFRILPTCGLGTKLLNRGVHPGTLESVRIVLEGRHRLPASERATRDCSLLDGQILDAFVVNDPAEAGGSATEDQTPDRATR